MITRAFKGPEKALFCKSEILGTIIFHFHFVLFYLLLLCFSAVRISFRFFCFTSSTNSDQRRSGNPDPAILNGFCSDRAFYVFFQLKAAAKYRRMFIQIFLYCS